MIDSPALGPEFEAALAYAARVHRAQVRNDTTIRVTPEVAELAGALLERVASSP